MNSSKTYVELDPQGVLRVGSLGVSLDSVVIAFQEGHSPETIQQLYPALSLEEVYGAVAYFLANRNEVDQYLKRQEQLWEQAHQRAARILAPWCNVSAQSARFRARQGHESATTPGRQRSQRRDCRGYTTARAGSGVARLRDLGKCRYRRWESNPHGFTPRGF